MSATAPLLFNPESEKSLLGGLIATPQLTNRLLADEGLAPEHFAHETCAATFKALVGMVDRGEVPDELTLTAELETAGVGGAREFVFSLFDQMPAYGALPTLARQIRGLHRRRQLRVASSLVGVAADTGNMAHLEQAEAILTTPADAERTSWTGLELAERFEARLDAPAPDVWSWPFRELNRWTGGGLRRQQVVLIGGWTSHGKSVLYDQILEQMARHGLRVHSYINEMSEQERMDRTMARLSGIPFERVHARRLDAGDREILRKALPRVKVGITECAGWTAPEIARHIRFNRWDVAGVDIIHEIAHREERDLAEIAQVLRSTAKSIGCALVACVHLNDNRVTSPQRPAPVQRDIRGSGMLSRGADIVLLVHRDDNEHGIPTEDGALYAPKIRNGKPGAMDLIFDPVRMRFLPKERELEAVA